MIDPSRLMHNLANARVIVQGITGTHGSFHTAAMLEAGTKIVAGVTPGKAGQVVSGVPVYDSVHQARQDVQANTSVVFVPAPFAKDACLEAIAAGIELLVIITEHIPVHDVLDILARAEEQGTMVVGPNCPGLLVPGGPKLGIIPQAVGKAGSVAVVSRSGTLTYEAAASLSAAGIGQRVIIGIGGDRLRGLSFVDCLQAFEADTNAKSIVLIGEIGGQDEQAAADYIKASVTKPVFAYVVGHSAPAGTQLGHAGAIMGGQAESAAAKTNALRSAGALTAGSLPELIDMVVNGASQKDLNE